MKLLIVTMIALSAPILAHADSGSYVCSEQNTSASFADDAQALLNSLKCDTNKPFTVTLTQSGYTLVCCVQK